MKFRKPKGLLELKRLVTEVLPSGALDTFREWGFPDNYPLRPQWLVCDCCLERRDRLWFYPHRGFCIAAADGQRVEFAAGEWAFCVYCDELRRQGDYRSLAARVETLNPDAAGADLADTYGTLFHCIHGDRRYWEAGMKR